MLIEALLDFLMLAAGVYLINSAKQAVIQLGASQTQEITMTIATWSAYWAVVGITVGFIADGVVKNIYGV